MAPDADGADIGVDLAPDLLAHPLRGAVEEVARSPLEIAAQDPAGMDHAPAQVVLHHPLQGPGLGPLLGAQAAVQIDPVLVLDMGADEGRVGDQLAFIFNEWKLSLGRAVGPRHVLAIVEPRHLQLDFGLGDIGADLGQTEAGTEAVQGDHRRSPS